MLYMDLKPLYFLEIVWSSFEKCPDAIINAVKEECVCLLEGRLNLKFRVINRYIQNVPYKAQKTNFYILRICLYDGSGKYHDGA